VSRVRRLAMTAMAIACLTGLPGASALAAQHLNAYSLQGDFICVSCHEPLNQVHSPEAQAEKQTLQQLVDQGLDLSQIKRRMVNIYTEEVLAAPPAHGVNLLIYILPPLVLVGGLGFLAYNLPQWRRRGRLAAQNAPSVPEALNPQEAERLDAELRTFDA
jgi:cytochrome c-type biogenesis protein CcmH/NrfF